MVMAISVLALQRYDNILNYKILYTYIFNILKIIIILKIYEMYYMLTFNCLKSYLSIYILYLTGMQDP